MKKNYLISYDITDDRKRAKAADTLKDYGSRVQKSVFECRLKKKSMIELKGKLNGIIDKDQDSVLIYPLCEACINQKKTMGVNIVILKEAFRVL